MSFPRRHPTSIRLSIPVQKRLAFQAKRLETPAASLIVMWTMERLAHEETTHPYSPRLSKETKRDPKD